MATNPVARLFRTLLIKMAEKKARKRAASLLGYYRESALREAMRTVETDPLKSIEYSAAHGHLLRAQQYLEGHLLR